MRIMKRTTNVISTSKSTANRLKLAVRADSAVKIKLKAVTATERKQLAVPTYGYILP